MMQFTSFEDLNEAIQGAFAEFYTDTFLQPVTGANRFYYKWDFNWICDETGLNYHPVDLSCEIKENEQSDNTTPLIKELKEHQCKIGNSAPEISFLPTKYWFQFKNSHQIPNELREPAQEFIFWKMLESVNDVFSDQIKSVVKRQKNNFLFTYIKYLTQKGSWKHSTDYTTTSHANNVFIQKNLRSKIEFVNKIENSSSLEELKNLLEKLGGNATLGTKDFIGFRGQACASWPLDSSLTRIKKFHKRERDMYYDVVNTAPSQFRKDNDLFQKLVRLQHYNLPTRLMDITRNPLVAIYFACCNSEKKMNDAAVFVFKTDNNNVLNYDDKITSCFAKRVLCKKEQLGCDTCHYHSTCVSHEKYKNLPCASCDDLENCSDKDKFWKNWIVNGYLSNPRIDNQKGDFLFINNNSHNILNEYIDKIIIIESSLKSILLEKLESLNIHAGTLFPDLPNLNNYIKEKYNRI